MVGRGLLNIPVLCAQHREGVGLCPFSCVTKALPPLRLLTGEAWLQGPAVESEAATQAMPQGHTKHWQCHQNPPPDEHSHSTPDGHDIGGQLASDGELDPVWTGREGLECV